MAKSHSKPRALFIFFDLEPKPDDEICSGQFPSHLDGKPCPYSDHGRMPRRDNAGGEILAQQDLTHQVPKLIRSCRLQALGRLEQWKSDVPLGYPKELENEILYKCRQMFMVVLLR